MERKRGRGLGFDVDLSLHSGWVLDGEAQRCSLFALTNAWLHDGKHEAGVFAKDISLYCIIPNIHIGLSPSCQLSELVSMYGC